MTRFLQDIARLHQMDEREFLSFAFQLVSTYRRESDAQEPIAVALTRKNLDLKDAAAAERVGILLAMLQHVHDPQIASGLIADQNAVA